jgi:predicted RNA-binding protein with PIN domain
MKRVLLVDGYNVLCAWKGVPRGKLEDARDELIHVLSDYAGYSGQQVTLVFDAWQSDRPERSREQRGALTVVFTKRGETADHYIERLCDGYAASIDAGRMEVRVATSDGVEQTVVLARGATRLPSRELIEEIERMRIPPAIVRRSPTQKATVLEHLPTDVRQKLERMRRGE